MGPLTAEERYLFDLQGFLVRRGALRVSEVKAANDAVDLMALPRPGASIGSQRFSDHCGVAAIFRSLIDHPAVLEILGELCGRTLRLDHTYGIVMAPGTSGLGLHGGAVPFDPSQYYCVDSSGIHCGLVAVQWALVDAWPGEGGFACVPGSHKTNMAMPGSIDLHHPCVREVPLRAGDMVLFSEALTHGTLDWRGPGDRRTLLYKYSPGNSSWALEPAVSSPVLALLTPRRREICGPPAVAHRQNVV